MVWCDSNVTTSAPYIVTQCYGTGQDNQGSRGSLLSCIVTIGLYNAMDWTGPSRESRESRESTVLHSNYRTIQCYGLDRTFKGVKGVEGVYCLA